MKCTFCPNNDATCHLTKLVHGKAIEVHVCEKCIPEIKDENLIDFDIWEAVSKLAKKKGMADPTEEAEEIESEEISAKSLLIPKKDTSSKSSCKNCGFSAEDLRKTGRLGCSQCYEVFTEMLEDVINDCQKAGKHIGKVPSSLVSLKKQHLEERLQEAVEAERFEEAVILRDQLKTLEESV